MKKLMMAVAFFALGLTVFAATSDSDPMGSQSAVELGKWCNDFPAALEYAESNNLPLLVFWANPGCSQCEKLEKACNESDFVAWQNDRKYVMVFAYGTTKTADSKAKKWIKKIESLSQYPFIGVSWTDASGKRASAAFTGRNGTMPSTGGSLQQQLMDSVDELVRNSPVPPPPAPVVYKVTFVIDAEKATYKGSLAQEVESGKAATAPVVTAKDGWEFTGWDKAFDKVSSDLTVTAKFKEVGPEPEPTIYKVTFVIDAEKATYTGDLEQEVAEGKSAKAPEVKAKDGWEFTGWDKSYSNVASDLVVTATFEEVEPAPEVDLQTVYKKSQKFDALVQFDGSNFGLATVTIGKISKTKGTVKLTVKVTPFAGSAVSASATVKPEKDGSIAGTLAFKKTIGALDYALVYDAKSKDFEFVGENDDFAIERGEYKLGGSFESDELSFFADFTDDVELDDDSYFEVEPPAGEPIYVKGGTKFSCDKATSIKVKKIDDDFYDVERDYGKNDDKTNESGLKISYKAAKGTFSGSFKVYVLTDDGEKKPKLKSYSAKFSGIVIDQVGSGSFSVKIGKKTYAGTCGFE